MDCPHCRAANPDESRFCNNCGKPIGVAPATAPHGPVAATPPTAGAPLTGAPLAATGGPAGVAPVPEDRTILRPIERSPALERPERITVPPPAPEPESRSALGWVAAALLVLLVIGIGIWLLTRPHPAPSVAAVPSRPIGPGPSVVRAPAVRTPGPPVAAQPAQPQGMPQDIRRYLAFLQDVERQRKAYEGQLTNRMLAIVPNLLMPNFDNENVKPPDQQMVQQYTQMAQQYAQAANRFQAAAQQIQVPEACRKLHGDYSQALSMNPREIMDTANRLRSGDYSGLLQMRSSVGRTVEDYYRAADDELARICAQYGERKMFDIGNGGGDSILMP